MKCRSRSTLGVVVGSLNVLVYLAFIIYALIALNNINSTENSYFAQKESVDFKNKVISVVLVLLIIMIVITGLFIRGIVKRRHKLMMPWLIIIGITFIHQCGEFLFSFIGSLIQGNHLSTILITIIVGLLAIGITALILWQIITLFVDIRKENIERPGQATRGKQPD